MTNTLLTLHDPALARRYYAEGLWRRDTLYTLLCEHAARRPEAFALRDARAAADLERAARHGRRGRRRSRRGRAEARRAGLGVAAEPGRGGRGLARLLAPGLCLQPVAAPELHGRRDRRAAVAHPGGGAVRPARLRRRCAHRRHLRRRRGAAVVAADLFARATAPSAAAPFPDRAAGALPPADADPDKIVYLAFTSGTTGTPKGVMHSDNTLLANGRAMVADWRHDERTVLLSLSPMSHHIGTVAIEQMMAAGLELVVNAPPPGLTPLDWIIETGATYVMGVPTHAMDILAELRRRRLDRLGEVKVFYMAGSPIPREVAQAFLDRGVMPQNVYGMTENSSHQYTLPSDDPRDHRRDLRPRLPRLRDPPVGQGEPRYRGAARRDRRDRRPRRLPDARLFRQPASDRGIVQPLRLVHERRSRPARRATATSRSSAARRT